MKYDFTSLMDRRGHDAIAVDGPGTGRFFAPDVPAGTEELIPMWVADMNFPVFPGIQEAIMRRVSHPAFGYFAPTKEYYGAIIRWQETRNQVSGLAEEHIGYENGVLGGVMSALGAMCVPGEKVLLHTPAYIGFTGSLKNAGYEIVPSPLKRDEGGVWRMDFEDMERIFRDEPVHTMIFCSPHNPSGRVWSCEEMEEMLSLCEKYEVGIVSDEIWSDLILTHSPVPHTPLMSVNRYAKEHTAALYAPSKTFNLAGLVGSYHIVYNRALRERMNKYASRSHYNDMNVLSMHALIGAYSEEGAVWVDELREVLSGNVNFAAGEIREKWSGVSFFRPEGTYMLFLDAEEWCRNRGVSADELLRRGWNTGVAWQDGRPFGGTHTIRMNLALPLTKVREAFDRLNRVMAD